MVGGFGGRVSIVVFDVVKWLFCSLVLMLLRISVTWASYAWSVSGRWVIVVAYIFLLWVGGSITVACCAFNWSLIMHAL